jgi:hypothetical protein
MVRFFHTPFPYLDRQYYRLLHVLVILVFSVLFLIVFEPFRITDWIRYPQWLESFGLVSIGVCIALTIAFSQLLLRTLLPFKKFTKGQFILWTLAEILLASLFATLLYADNSGDFLPELLTTLKYMITGLVLPYAFSILILILLQQKSRGSFAEKSLATDNSELVHIRDERDQVKFSVRRDYILYLESADNYVTIFYLPESEVKKEMVRTSMKKMEAFLRPHGLVRCHRSFMVNMENVQWMKKTGRNYQIKMKKCPAIIPVSRGYDSMVKSLILE